MSPGLAPKEMLIGFPPVHIIVSTCVYHHSIMFCAHDVLYMYMYMYNVLLCCNVMHMYTCTYAQYCHTCSLGGRALTA